VAISLIALAVVAGVGAGIYAKVPNAFARPSSNGASSAEPTPTPTKPSEEPTEPAAPPALRDTPPATPPAKKAPAKKAPVAKGPCARTGPSQLVVERYLSAHPAFGPVTVDGKQSAADCAAIKKFQVRYGVQPMAGYAGPVSGQVASRLGKAAKNRCSAGSGVTVCVDLTSQTMWVVRGGAIVYGPTTIRTGRAGMATPAGRYSIGDKKKYTVSTEYKDTPLPYWQRFSGMMGFHQTPSYLYDGGSPGSHGCINLLRRDAIALYGLTKRGTPVHIFGTKPGT
jgi:lipoprotein-anchoring transpeptidase ErfK/SrfK